MAKYYSLLHPLPGCDKGDIFVVKKDSPWARPLGKHHGDIWLDSKLVQTAKWWFKAHKPETKINKLLKTLHDKLLRTKTAKQRNS